MFHCLEHDGEGGATLVVDGFTAAENLRKDDIESFRQLTNTPVRHEYREPSYNVCSLGTILQTDTTTDDMRMVR